MLNNNKSSKRRTSKRSNTSVKVLISAASLTAVLGGWAGFSMNQSSSTSDAGLTAFGFPLLPTLVSPSDRQSQSAVDANTSSDSPSSPVLRSVRIPRSNANTAPQIVTRTRTSR